MNNDKTEIILYGTKQQLAKMDLSGINVEGCFVTCIDHVRDLGVCFDANLNFDRVSNCLLSTEKPEIYSKVSEINGSFGTWVSSFTIHIHNRLLQWTFNINAKSD